MDSAEIKHRGEVIRTEGMTVYVRMKVESACIKCAKCVAACPMGLEPYLISKLSRRKMWERAEQERVTDCIECGCCQYSCPANVPLLDYIRHGKQTVMGMIRARAAQAKK